MQSENTPLLRDGIPTPVASQKRIHHRIAAGFIALALAIGAAIVLLGVYLTLTHQGHELTADEFYHNIAEPPPYCAGEGKSYSGHIGVLSDSESSPKRAFFWYHEAEHSPETAPIVVTVGGGPGTSGLTRLMNGDGPCMIQSDGPQPNLHKWSNEFNIIAVDYPVGVGFSYGSMVNSSEAAAMEMYDFLQKLLVIFPKLQGNPLVVNGGSYGGMYVPHIANMINQQNKLVALGRGRDGARHLNLESIMISNPISNFMSYTMWMPEMFCVQYQIWNATQCDLAYRKLPACLQKIQLAFDQPTDANREAAFQCGDEGVGGGILVDLHGVMRENINKRCNGTVEDCFPEFLWQQNWFQAHKGELGVPPNITYVTLSEPIYMNFRSTSDKVQISTRFFPQLLRDGIRILHRVGMLDLNCAWPGVLNGLEITPTDFQSQFAAAKDVPWPGEEDDATVRVIGDGAGDMTYVQIWNAGHFVSRDTPRIERQLASHWINNIAFDR
ncbi:hypothetical protein FRB96_007149 [Tulasnella sp. 330]|nr:hypothetical protein FRB96_007149 [Tulasnella sp. 330]KAG8871407.1 hypothetical protein FRB98_000803 [Tulasnella sp. 332]